MPAVPWTHGGGAIAIYLPLAHLPYNEENKKPFSQSYRLDRISAYQNLCSALHRIHSILSQELFLQRSIYTELLIVFAVKPYQLCDAFLHAVLRLDRTKASCSMSDKRGAAHAMVPNEKNKHILVCSLLNM